MYDMGTQLYINVAHELALIDYKSNRLARGMQFATAMSVLAGTYEILRTPWSERPASQKRIDLRAKLFGLVSHDRCLNYHYIKGSELLPKI